MKFQLYTSKHWNVISEKFFYARMSFRALNDERYREWTTKREENKHKNILSEIYAIQVSKSKWLRTLCLEFPICKISLPPRFDIARLISNSHDSSTQLNLEVLVVEIRRVCHSVPKKTILRQLSTCLHHIEFLFSFGRNELFLLCEPGELGT